MPNHNKKTRACRQSLYHVRNWTAYENALVQRGSLTFWWSDDLPQTWIYVGEKQRGAQFTYSDDAIRTMLTVREVFHLTNRQVEGFMRSLFKLWHLPLPVPDHSTLARRGQCLRVNLPHHAHGPLTLVLDSTGLKVYGEGEWKVRQHGYTQRRTWRKLHLGVDAESGEIQVAALTANSVSDDQMAEPLLQQLDRPLTVCAADGGYDKRKVYASLAVHAPTARVLIPPRQNARIWQHGNTHAERLVRDENLRAIRRQGRTRWKCASGYHVRSLAEVAMFRLKRMFGEHLSAHLLTTQTTQALVRCAALNRVTQAGVPQSFRLA